MAQKEMSRLDRIKAELICSLCLDILTEPRKLDCDHSFCQECLQNYLQRSVQPRDSPPVQADVAGSEQQPAASLVCPFCKEKTTLPEKGVSGLRHNFKLKSMVDILSEEQREKTVQALGKGHKIKCHKQCTQHQGEDCVFFCEDCKVLICRICLSDSHKQHKWSNYDEILPKFKEEIRGSIQPAYEAAVSAQDAMQQLDRSNSAVIQNQNFVKEKVEEYFDQLATTLRQRKSWLLSMIDHYTDRKLEMLKQHSSDLQSGHSSLLQHLEQIEKQMEEDDVSLLTGIDAIKQQISQHCDAICGTLSSTKGVDSFIELREESMPLQLDCLGRLVLCQRDPHSDVVSAVQEFVDTGDMEDIQLDLARPADGMTVPEYMQFRRPETEDIYEKMVSPGKLTTATHELPPNTSQPPLPPAPVSQKVEASMEVVPPHSSLLRPPAPLPPSVEEVVEGEGQLVEENMEQPPPCARKDRPPAPLPPTVHEDEDERHEGEEMEEEPYSEASDSEDPYDTIPAREDMVHRHFPHRPRLPSIPSRRPDFIKPIQMIDLQNSDVRPSGIACTNLYGQLYITDTKNMCLHMLDGEEILESVEGTKERSGCLIKFQKPVALTFSKNHAYVLEQGNTTAIFHKFSLNGDFVFTSFKRSRRKGPFKPWGIATSKEGDVYVSDWKKGQIYVYDSANGKKIRSIKGCTIVRGGREEFVKFQQPAGIAIDRGGRLMVTDRGEKCVWCINTEGDELIRKLGEHHLQNPYGIGVAKDGRVVVTESESDCVSVFGETGELLQYFGRSGSNEGQFCRPHHVFVDESDRVFIADKENRRIQVFKLP